MTSDQLPKLINARPFQPFTIHMADGRALEVRHPENIAYGGGRLAVVVEGDAFEVIDLLLVPSVRGTLAPPAGPGAGAEGAGLAR